MLDIVPSMGAADAVRPFDFDGHPIRVVMLPGLPKLGDFGIPLGRGDDATWFVAADVCRALGLAASVKGTFEPHLRKLNATERLVIGRRTHPQFWQVGAIAANVQLVSVLSESGLYKLIMRSDKPTAKRFQDWVTKVVLPNIRKHGGHIAGQEHDAPEVQAETVALIREVQELRAGSTS